MTKTQGEISMDVNNKNSKELWLGTLTGHYRTAFERFRDNSGETTNVNAIRALIRQTKEYQELMAEVQPDLAGTG